MTAQSFTATARILDVGDVKALRALMGVFGRAFDDPVSYLHNPPSDAYLTELLARDTFVAVVAELSGSVIGGLAGYVLPKLEQARSEFYIYDLAVEVEHRRKGVATTLIRCVQEHANRKGIYVIYVQADPGDEPAISLYTKLGTREDVMHFDIPPADVDTSGSTVGPA